MFYQIVDVPAVYRVVLMDNLNNFIDGVFNLSLASIILFNLFFKIFLEYIIYILCELTLFDERIFGEWWNARSSEDFWNKWNLPVHHLVKKHIYAPFICQGMNKNVATLIYFIFSGALHEYVVFMSLKYFNGWFLIGMVAQIPLNFVTNYVKSVLRVDIQHCPIYFFGFLFVPLANLCL